MPSTTAEIDARNRLLDELKAALDEWHDKEIKRIDDEVLFVKSVLRGRTGSERLSRSNTEEGRLLVIDDIASFLTGVST
jgi:hypothetical protein